MTILFVMPRPEFLFQYASAVEALASRGHAVTVAFERAPTPELLERAAAASSRITLESLPACHDEAWVRRATRLRTFQDYLRYLEPRYAHAGFLRRRVEARVPRALRTIAGLTRRLGPAGLGAAHAVARAIERRIPVPPAIRQYLAARAPEVLLVTPLVDIGSRQVDYVKAAAALGIPCGLCVASWDNLSNKGLIRVVPDRVFVWNETQRAEATSMHRIPADRVTITGAQIFDHWFHWRPSTTREEFCRRYGLDPRRPYLLFVGSTPGIAADETSFVLDWIRAVRSSGAPALDSAGILVRPHPRQWARWQQVAVPALGNVALQPSRPPTDPQSRSEYYDALYHSAAVVGINTSAFIEAAIVGRPVFALLAHEFAETQQGTLHFHYLAHRHGGPVRTAASRAEHFAQLSQALRDPVEAHQPRHRQFIESFVRPHGLDAPALPILVEAIERLAMPSTT